MLKKWSFPPNGVCSLSSLEIPAQIFDPMLSVSKLWRHVSDMSCHQAATSTLFPSRSLDIPIHRILLWEGEGLKKLWFYRTQVSLGSNLWVHFSLTNSLRDVWFNLTDVTQADEDTNSILTDNANRAFQRNLAMQWHNLVANFCK